MKELALVMPVYNESGSIQTVLQKWNTTLKQLQIDYLIHAYNDGSKDNSLQLLKDIAQNEPHVIVHDKPNSGHGPTILQGYRDQTEAEWIFQIDSDDELIPDDFGKLWQNRTAYDLLIGKRHNRSSSYVRRIVSVVSRLVVRIFYGHRVWDVNCPYRLMRSEKFRDVFLSIPNLTFAPNLIISGTASLRKMSVYQTEISYQPRQSGEVSIKKFKLLKAAVKSFWQTISYRFGH
jgi:dolichol-phosphate mannosyltransferase